jgi:polyisoprenoid-binding protein YceI
MKTTTALALALSAAVAAPAALAQAGTYNIDPNHTNVYFEQLHFGITTNRARFDKKSGTVRLDRAGKTGRVELTLDMTGINSGVAGFDRHLSSPDFFDVANNPTATFVGDGFKFDGDKLSEVSGQLTLRGKTNPVTLKALRFGCFNHPMLKREVCGGDFETTIKRSLWGVNWGLANNAAPDDTKVVVQVEAIKTE